MNENKNKTITESATNFRETMQKFAEIMQSLVRVNSESLNSLYEATKPIKESIDSFKKSLEPLFDITRAIALSLQPWIEGLEKAKNNPDSNISWYKYYSMLSKWYWVFPYGISTTELKELTSKEISEKTFDEYMEQHFTNDLIKELESETIKILPQNHHIIYKQCVKSLSLGSYALCNLGFISIIDDLTSIYLQNKGCPKRYGIFEPIVNDLEQIDLDEFSIERKRY